MKGAPWFKFFPADFIGGTVELSSEERGSYITLLCAQWMTGSLPAEHDRLERIAGGRVTDLVRGKFVAGQDGRLRNDRLESHREEATAKSRVATSAAAKRWECERNAKASADAMQTHMRTHSERNANGHADAYAEARGQRLEARGQNSEATGEKSEKDESCGQAGNTALPPEASPVVIWFPCTGSKDLWPLTQAMIDGWAEAYPAVDVLAECRKAKAWEDSNPKNRKTFDGHARYLNTWLAKAQNQARAVPVQGQPSAAPEKPRGTWDIKEQIELLRSERDRLYMSDFQNSGGPERNADRYAKWLDVSKKVRDLQGQIAGKA